MKKLFATFAFILAASALSWGGQLTLIDNGQSNYVIVVPQDAEERAKVEFAAKSLQKYLKLSTGVELPIYGEDEIANQPAFYLGKTAKGQEAGVPYAEMHDYYNCRKIVGADIFLAGCDDSPGVTGPLQHHDREYLSQLEGLNLDIKDQSYRRCYGTLKAVLSFLDEEDIVKILLPGPNGRHIIKHDVLEISDELDYFGSPAIPYCYGFNYGDLETTVALNHNNPPFFKNYGGHSFHVAVPVGKYCDSHPEYFILKDGKRQPFYGPAGGNHLCLTNPDVKRLMLEEVERQYNYGYRWIQIGPTDGQVPCECDECRAIANGDPRERQWLFYRDLAEEAYQRWPDLKIVLLSYGLSDAAPQSFDSFPPNTIIEFCVSNGFEEKFQDYDRFRDVPKLSYIYFFGAYHSLVFYPKRSYKFVADNLQVLYQNNVMGISKCHWCTCPGLEGPVCYVFSKLLENPDADYNKLADDFYRYAYGTAYETMKRFFTYLNSRLDTPRGHSIINELEAVPRNPDALIQYTFPPDTMKYLRHLVWEAETMNDPDPAVRARLALVRREMDYLMCVTTMYALTNAFTIAPSADLIRQMEQTEAECNKLLDNWYDEKGMMKLEDGFYWPIMENQTKTTLRYGGGMIPYAFPPMIAKGYGPLKRQLNLPLTPSDCISLFGNSSTKESALSQPYDASFTAPNGDKIMLKAEIVKDAQFYFRVRVEPADAQSAKDGSDKVEIYLQPGQDKGTARFYCVSVSQDGTLQVKQSPAKDAPAWQDECQVEISEDARGWTALVILPWKDFCPVAPVPNETWKCNVRRKGATWSPATLGTTPADIANWGNLRYLSITRILPQTN